jgi:hypothetical protein
LGGDQNEAKVKLYTRPTVNSKRQWIEANPKRWLLIDRYPFVDSSCPPARARRNYWRLCAKHQEIMVKSGLSILSVYDPSIVAVQELSLRRHRFLHLPDYEVRGVHD